MAGNSLAVYLCPSLCKIPSFSGGGCLQKGNLMRGSVELERIPEIPKLVKCLLYFLHKKSRESSYIHENDSIRNQRDYI